MKQSFPEYHLFQILKRFDSQHLPLDLFLSQYFKAHKALGSKDRLIISEAIYGMARWKSLLDYLVDKHPTWEKRYAVYKNFQPEQYLFVNSIPLPIRVSFPDELFHVLQENYGQEKAIRFCQICNTPAPITIRINPNKTSRDAFLNKLLSLGMEASPCKASPLGINLKKRAPLTAMQEFKEGFFEIQDEASQLISLMVQTKANEHVLDYCSGSGGKTLGFAHKMGNSGQIYLHDIRLPILEQARKRLKRSGIQNAQFLDSAHPHLPKLKGKMDWVLVDAPCSGTGTLRRNPDQKWKFSLAQLKRLIQEQKEIFEAALDFVKPGGKIVYATCSILKDENEKQLDYFVKNFPLKLQGTPFVSLPAYGGMDGFFGAVCEKIK